MNSSERLSTSSSKFVFFPSFFSHSSPSVSPRELICWFLFVAVAQDQYLLEIRGETRDVLPSSAEDGGDMEAEEGGAGAAAEGGGGDPNKISYIVHPQVDREFCFSLSLSLYCRSSTTS